MSLLNDNAQKQIRQAFEALSGPVKIVMFTQGENAPECETCSDTRQLLEEVARAEIEDLARRSLERRLAQARLGRFKPLADFDWHWPQKIDRPLQVFRVKRPS